MIKTIKELEEAFDREFTDNTFCCCGREYCYPTENTNYEPIINIKQFLRTNIPLLLDSVVEELVGEEEDEEKMDELLNQNTVGNGLPELERYGLCVSRLMGSNNRRDEALARYQEIKKELIK
jgi:hypothetical protein